MDNADARKRFEEADALYRAGRYSEAVVLLQQLNAEYPNQRNVLYPLAFSLAAVGRIDEARALKDTLVAQFDDRRADRLERYIGECMVAVTPPTVKLETPANLPTMDLNDVDVGMVGLPQASGHLDDPLAAFDLNAPPQGALAKPIPNLGPDDDTLVWKIVLAVVTLLLTGMGVMSALGDTTTAEDLTGILDPAYQERFLANWKMAYAIYMLISTPVSMFIAPLPLYFVLHFKESLPYNLFWKNYFSAYAYSLSIYIGWAFCCIGCLVGYWLTNRRFELELSGLVFLNFFIGLYLLFSGLMLVVFLFLFFTFSGVPLSAFGA